MAYFPFPCQITIPMSFETNEQAVVKYTAPARIRIRNIQTTVVKALAASDAGTIVLKNNAGSTIATVTIPLSTAINDYSQTAADLVVEKGEVFTLTAAKTTAGGKAVCFLEYDLLTTA